MQQSNRILNCKNLIDKKIVVKYLYKTVHVTLNICLSAKSTVYRRGQTINPHLTHMSLSQGSNRSIFFIRITHIVGVS